MTAGRSLELFFVDGNPDGMLTAEVFNWTGHVLRIPKIRLLDGLQRREARQTGVYILRGETEDGPLAYVGEAEDMAHRLRSHAKEKDWWDEAILITTAGDALHKAHVKYLESRIVEAARDAGNTALENANIPPRSSLNEAATANMESFLDTLQMVLPAIRVDLLQNQKRVLPGKDTAETPAGLAREITPKYHPSLQKKHADLIGLTGTVVADDVATLGESFAFSSLSTAACIVLGRSSNGRTEWRLREDGRSYAEWEDSQLDAVDAA